LLFAFKNKVAFYLISTEFKMIKMLRIKFENKMNPPRTHIGFN